MKRYSKSDQIKDLIIALNEQRAKAGKVLVSRQWTGLGHWLKTEEKEYKCIGSIITNDSEFIGFLKGMLITQ